MADHIEPSHLDAPIKNLTGSSITKRTADSYHEVEQKVDRNNKRSKGNKDSNGDNKNKEPKRKEDIYEREFEDITKNDEVKIINENKNNDPEGPGIVIDVTV